jgi:hypothetical protein
VCGATVQVDVLPAQAQQFALTHRGLGRQLHQPPTLRKPNPLVLRKLDPLNAHLQVNILLLLVENFVVVSL